MPHSKNRIDYRPPSVGKPHNPEHPKYIEIYGHRGARGLAPDNSFLGYETALKLGIDWIDVDVCLTLNETIVACHDVSATEQKDLPTLQEIFDFVHSITKSKFYFQIEMKMDSKESPEKFASLLYHLIQQNQLIDHVEIQAFDWRCLSALQSLDKEIKTAYLVFDKTKQNPSLPQMIKELGGSCYEPRDTLLTKQEVIEAHSLGLKVVSWCYSEQDLPTFNSDLIQTHIDWGVDGLIVDDLIKIRSLLLSKKLQPPCHYTKLR